MDTGYKRILTVLDMYTVSVLLIYIMLLLNVSALDYRISLAAAALLLVLSIPLYFLSKKYSILRTMCFIINSAAIGFSMTAFYNYGSFVITLSNSITPFATVFAVLIINRLIKGLFDGTGILSVFNYLLCIGTIILSLVRLKTDLLLYSQLLFLALIYLSCCIACSLVKRNAKNFWLIISFSQFTLALIIFIIVLLFILEAGDGIAELIDIPDFSFKRRDKGQPPQPPVN
jgi:hypothetical protein